jgi:hypothetical protein
VSAGPPDHDGYNLFLSSSVIEWALTGLVTGIFAVAGWVWRLGVQVDRLRAGHRATKEDIEAVKKSAVELGERLDHKVDEEIKNLGAKIDRIRDELPSRQFIENQINNLVGRIDRVVDAKMGRT